MLNGSITTIDVECKAWDNLWNTPNQYESTLRTQFCKDFKKMEFLGQKNWIFKESGLIGDAAEFKNRIKNAFITNGVVCSEFTTDFLARQTSYAALLKLSEADIDTPVKFIDELFKDRIFKQIFFRK